MSKYTKKLSLLLCFHDEFTMRRITKLIDSENIHKVTQCNHYDDFQNYLDNHTYDIVISSLRLQDEDSLNLIKLYRFRYPFDKETKFYVFSLDEKVEQEDLLDAKVEGLISSWDLASVFKAA